MKIPQRLGNLKPLLLVAVLAVGGYVLYANRERVYYQVESVLPEGDSDVVPGILKEDLKEEEDYKTIATGLEIPWEIAFLPGGDMLVTERPGRVKRIGKDGAIAEITGIDDVRHNGEGGLLG